MKNIKRTALLFASLAGLLMLVLTAPVFAADQAKEITISGEAVCAKRLMHEGTKCQTIIQTKSKTGGNINYYRVKNEVSKNLHEDVCKAARKGTVTGTVRKEADGKRELTATKIALAK